jgi:hypothetical protein
LRKKTKEVILSLLKEKNYKIIDEQDSDYKYLLKMSMDSVSEENVDKLLKEYKEKDNELNIMQNTNIEDIWLKELQELEKVYKDYREERELLSRDELIKKKHVVKIKIDKKKESNFIIV